MGKHDGAASVLAQMKVAKAAVILAEMEVATAAGVIGEMEYRGAAKILAQMDAAAAVGILAEMEFDGAVGIIAEMETKDVSEQGLDVSSSSDDGSWGDGKTAVKYGKGSRRGKKYKDDNRDIGYDDPNDPWKKKERK